jgi:hypothetical protein
MKVVLLASGLGTPFPSMTDEMIDKMIKVIKEKVL